MWLKLCMLLIYITVLFLLARVIETMTWYETGSLSRRLLDPMALSVAKLKALLEHRGVSYDGALEKSELCQLVEGSGHLDPDDMESLQTTEEDKVLPDTNFTSGTHFYEQVEDAKDSVWLVQVVAYGQKGCHSILPLPDTEWKAIREKVSKFGVHTGILDCALDYRWCERRGWHTPHLLLALPQVHQQKANVAVYVYPGNWRQHLITQWIRQKLQEKVETIHDFRQFKDEWLTFRSAWEEPEIRAVFFSGELPVPMFFSALSVKFPGRVRFGVVNSSGSLSKEWTKTFTMQINVTFPNYLILTPEKIYIYGNNYGECLSFACMENFLKFLYPCLNDIFIISFGTANLLSHFEIFLTQGGLSRRLRRMLWCLVKCNSAVIMLWLPLIAIFQLPFLKDLPYIALKAGRVLATSPLGAALRRDYFFYSNHPDLVIASFLSVCCVFGLLAYWFTGGQYEEDSEPWFNFTQMRTLTHLRSNDFFEPMMMSGYALSRRMEIFGSRLSLAPLSQQPVVSRDYISLLPTWHYGSGFPVSTCSNKSLTTPTAPAHQLCARDLTRSFDICQASPGSNCETSPLHCRYCISAVDVLDGNSLCQCGDLECGRSEHTVHSYTHDPCDTNPSTNTAECHCQKCCHQRDVDSESPQHSLSTGSNWCHHGNAHSLECKASLQVAVDFPDGFLPCTQCVICLEEFSVGVKLCGLPCGHVFHHGCIIVWLKRDHHFCPICRWPSFQQRGHESNAVPNT